MLKKIYIKPCDGVPITSLFVLIDSLYKTVGGERQKYARHTYADENYTRYDCTVGRRSFDDLLCLARTYFPETTEVELMRTLKELELTFYFCSDIWKYVFHYNGDFDLKTNNFNGECWRPYYADGTYTREMLSDIYHQL